MRALSCVFLCLFCFTFVNSCLFFKWRPFKQKPHLAALILARGGSKGIRYKNIAKVGNKTLLNIAITEIRKSKGFNSIWVSTDNWKIFEEAQKENVNIYWRSRKSATDTATSISAVQEFLKDQISIDNIALIQCTSPFIKSHYLKIAIENINHYECVFSVTRSHTLQWKEECNKLLPVNFNPLKRPRRQDLKGFFVENGMFYFARRKLIEQGTFQTEW